MHPLSWTNNGAKSELWAVAGGRIWVLPGAQAIPVNGHALQVSAPIPAQAGTQASQLVALRMAPDGVRAALLVHTHLRNHSMLAAVSSDGMSFGPAVAVGTGLANPVALSWFDAYHLAVLTHGEVYEVPLTGSEGTQLGSVPPNAQTITSDSKLLVIGTSDGQLWTSAPGQLSWRTGPKGTNPTLTAKSVPLRRVISATGNGAAYLPRRASSLVRSWTFSCPAANVVMAPVRVRGCAGLKSLSAGPSARLADASRRRSGPRKATSRRPITVRLRSKSHAGGSDILPVGEG